ncbi:MFS transporter [Tenggerimyces flavus]|nr:MFS transporter [Tenggerimyces flavus]MBM7790300.1 MFS family permease [Tenggerimyces flavus]
MAADHANLRIAALGFGQLGVVVAFQAVAIVLPSIGADLRISPALLQWVVGATALTYAGGLLVAGRLADRYGGPRILVAGSLLMAAGSIAAAIAPHFAVLLLARVAQGIGMALYTPAMVSLLATGFAAGADRHRALIWWNVAGGAGGLIAVTGGGMIANHGWRATFLLLALAPLVTVLLAKAAFRRSQPEQRSAQRRVDVLNASLPSAAATLLVLGLTGLQQGMPIGVLPLAISVVLVVVWLKRERHGRHPLVPSSLRRWPALQPIVLATLHGAAINTPIFFYGLFLQTFRDATPLQVGLGFIPANVGLISGAVLGGAIIRRRGHHAAMISGMAVIVVGIGLLLTVDARSTVWHPFLLAWLVFGVGAAVAQAGFIGLAGKESADESGTTAGFLTSGGQIGTAIGLAAFVGLAGIPADNLTGYRIAFLAAMLAAALGAAVAAIGRRQPQERPVTPAYNQ